MGFFFPFVYLNGTDDLIQIESQIFVPVCYFCMQPIILFLGLGSEWKIPKRHYPFI